jgi:hypothetical protein
LLIPSLSIWKNNRRRRWCALVGRCNGGVAVSASRIGAGTEFYSQMGRASGDAEAEARHGKWRAGSERWAAWRGGRGRGREVESHGWEARAGMAVSLSLSLRIRILCALRAPRQMDPLGFGTQPGGSLATCARFSVFGAPVCLPRLGSLVAWWVDDHGWWLVRFTAAQRRASPLLIHPPRLR